MEGGSEGDFLLHDQSSSPLPQPKLRRLRKVPQFGPPALPDPTPLPEAPLEPPETTATLDFENLAPESDGIGTEIDPELELDPLFSDLNQLEAKRTEIGREEEGFAWGAGIGCATADEINDGIENAKSAKKRLILEGECENAKKNKKRKSVEKPKESSWEKRKLEKEKYEELELIQLSSGASDDNDGSESSVGNNMSLWLEASGGSKGGRILKMNYLSRIYRVTHTSSSILSRAMTQINNLTKEVSNLKGRLLEMDQEMRRMRRQQDLIMRHLQLDSTPSQIPFSSDNNGDDDDDDDDNDDDDDGDDDGDGDDSS